jgi:hypothetical protein
VGASSRGANLEIPPWLILRSNHNPLSGFGTLHGGQFDWGGRLPKRNGGVRRFAQAGRISAVECNGISELDCETYMSSRYESRS